MKYIGIDEEDLKTLIAEAYQQGYQMARKDIEQQEWLTSRAAICKFLRPEKPLSTTQFNKNRRAGIYGEAIIGTGNGCKCRKSDLLNAIRQYELSRL